MSVCCSHPQKRLTEPFFTHAVYGCDYADTESHDKNSPKIIKLVLFLSDYGCADTDTDTETWNRGLILCYSVSNSLKVF